MQNKPSTIEYINEHPIIKFLSGTIAGLIGLWQVDKIKEMLQAIHNSVSEANFKVAIFILIFALVFGVLEVLAYTKRKHNYYLNQTDFLIVLLMKILRRKNKFKMQNPTKPFNTEGFKDEEMLLYNSLSMEFKKNLGLILNQEVNDGFTVIQADIKEKK